MTFGHPERLDGTGGKIVNYSVKTNGFPPQGRNICKPRKSFYSMAQHKLLSLAPSDSQRSLPSPLWISKTNILKVAKYENSIESSSSQRRV